MKALLAGACLFVIVSCGPGGEASAPGAEATEVPTARSPSPAGSLKAASSPGAGSGPARLADFEIKLPQQPISAGSVELAVRNDGPTIHNLSIRDASGTLLLRTPDLDPGAVATLSGQLAPGRYVAFCSVPGHESLGMKLDVVVRAP